MNVVSQQLTPESPAKLKRLIIGTGVAFVILQLASMWLISRTPDSSSTEEAITAFYDDRGDRWLTLAGMYTIPFAAIAFIWFVVSFRALLLQRVPTSTANLQGTVQLAAGFAFITLTLAGAGARTALAASIQFSDVEATANVTRVLSSLSDSFQLVFAIRMAAMFILTSTSLARAAKLFPRWLTIVSLFAAVVLFLSASLSIFLVLIFPIWVFIVCAHLAVILPDQGVDKAMGPNPVRLNEA